MSDLKSRLSEVVGAAFAATSLPADLGRVTLSDRPDLADFQCNGAMAAAKLAKRNPREIAQSVRKNPAKPPFDFDDILPLNPCNCWKTRFVWQKINLPTPLFFGKYFEKILHYQNLFGSGN